MAPRDKGVRAEPSEGGADEELITGTVARVTFESPTNGYRVLKLDIEGKRDRVTVVGNMPPMSVGAHIRVRGRREQSTHGEQIRALSVLEIRPSTQAGLERYLGSGAISGIGPSYAKRIVAAFGERTLAVLDHEPHLLHRVSGLGKKRVETLIAEWGERRQEREVVLFLAGHNVGAGAALRVYKVYGAETLRVVGETPHRLAIDVAGVGFRTADAIASSLGIATDHPQRLEAGLLHVLGELHAQGHTVVDEATLYRAAAELLALQDHAVALANALRALAHDGHVESDALGVSTARLAHAEALLAACIEDKRVEAVDALSFAPVAHVARAPLSDEQRSAVLLAATSPLMLLTGGPGVGKTTTLREVVSMYHASGLRVALVAPTGRAARRMFEATGAPATTVHKLLEFDPRRGGFRRNATAPVDADAIVVDECSMLDVELAAALLSAIPVGARLLLVGDQDQLPSVGPGAVLRDLCAHPALHHVHLTQLFRQAEKSLITVNAHRVNAGEMPLTSPTPDGDFFVLERDSAESARDTVVELVTSRIPGRFGLDPLRDIQVLTPMHRGAAGSMSLNQALRAKLLPGATRQPFDVGDKVLQLKNDHERDISNGDMGVVTAFGEAGALTMRLDDGRDVTVSMAQRDELSLAYACSVHKSQGSEYAAVVIVLLNEHHLLLSRPLLYTAMTRGRRLVILVGQRRAIERAAKNHDPTERRTRLPTLFAERGR